MESLVTSLPWDRVSTLHLGLSRTGPRLGLRVQTVMGLGSSLRVQGLGFMVSGFRVYGVRVLGLVFRVWGLGFRVEVEGDL